MAKPSGAVCNIDCEYCFYLEKEVLYPDRGRDWRMSDSTLELFVRQYIEAQESPVIDFAWQGGEPTLLGTDFYRRAVELQERYRDGKTIRNSFQTNGVLLDDEWGELLAEHGFLVGISIDGPREVHDHYRKDKGGKPTFDRVMAGLDVLVRYGVEFNTLTTVHAHGSRFPRETYRFLKEAGSRFLQFIPIVERVASKPCADGLTLVTPGFGGEARVTPWSVSAAKYGSYLCAVFDEWVREDVGRVFVQIFDVALAAWVGGKPPLCVFAETCGDALVLEHNGDLYSCDHFVYPEYALGNIHDGSMGRMVTSPAQRRFGADKRDTLPAYCRRCEVRFVCNGGCPKHRFMRTPDGETGLNYLCEGYKAFFRHAAPYMEVMAEELSRRRAPAGVMEWVAREDRLRLERELAMAGRNDPCPCGSGRKTKRCHGR
jgi:uncharacterized protein